MDTNADIDRVIADAFAAAQQKRPVLVDVAIDYSKRTRFTQGIVKTNLDRFDIGTKARLIGRALWRALLAGRSRQPAEDACSLPGRRHAFALLRVRQCAETRAAVVLHVPRA